MLGRRNVHQSHAFPDTIIIIILLLVFRLTDRNHYKYNVAAAASGVKLVIEIKIWNDTCFIFARMQNLTVGDLNQFHKGLDLFNTEQANELVHLMWILMWLRRQSPRRKRESVSHTVVGTFWFFYSIQTWCSIRLSHVIDLEINKSQFRRRNFLH